MLLPAHASHDLIAKVRSSTTQTFHRGVEVRDLYREAIPAARLGKRPVRHCLTTSGSAARGAENEAKIAQRKHREGRCGMHVLMETELAAVERDRLVDIFHDVPNADRRHAGSPRLSTTSWTIWLGAEVGINRARQEGEKAHAIVETATANRYWLRYSTRQIEERY